MSNHKGQNMLCMLGSLIQHELVAAGPVNIHERVLRAMNVPGQNHRDPFFAPFFKQLVQDSK
jgi:alanine-glyoxylate transaminase/serine-glyoxylate transaminase/serine-pyruvate transaminase